MCLELINIIITSFLSLLLIISTIIISIKQNKLQKNISESQNNIQLNIAQDNIKVALYQSRINCYLQIIQAVGVICDNRELLYRMPLNIQPALDALSNGRKLVVKSYIEAEALFDEDVVKLVKDIHDKYNHFVKLLHDMTYISEEEWSIKSQSAIPKILMKLNAQNEFSKTFTNYSSFFDIIRELTRKEKKQDYIDILIEVFPEYQDIHNIETDFQLLYKPKNKLFQLISRYVHLK